MDNHPGLNSKPNSQQLFGTTFDPSSFFEDEEGSFPLELSSLSEFQLQGLSDTLFGDLDSTTPDLRSMERYEAVSDELTARQYHEGVA